MAFHLFFPSKIAPQSRPSISYTAISIIAATIFLLLSVIGNYASAQTSAPPPASPPAAVKQDDMKNKFTEHKEKELARIKKHLEIMQTMQSCVQAATDHDAMKACHKAAKEAKESEHHKHS